MIWINATANRERLNSKEQIKEIIEKCVTAVFTDLIIDMKSTSGLVLFNELLHDYTI